MDDHGPVKVYFSVYQTASARCDQPMLGWDKPFVCSMMKSGWSLSQVFTSASRLSNPVFRLRDSRENSFSFTIAFFAW